MANIDLFLTSGHSRVVQTALRMFRCFIVTLAVGLSVGDALHMRTIRGTVTDENGMPLSGAVVQLQDKFTLRIRSYVTQKDGSYHFPDLVPDLTYHLRAKYAGIYSKSKRFSKFDSHQVDTIHLTIRLAK